MGSRSTCLTKRRQTERKISTLFQAEFLVSSDRPSCSVLLFVTSRNSSVGRALD